MLAGREALAAEPGADPSTAKVDVGRSLIAVGRALEATGKSDEAAATYRKAETCWRTWPGRRPTRPRGPRWRTAGSRMGWLLSA